MQNRAVADRAVFADIERKANVGVQRRAFLDIGARADANAFVVAAQRRAEPHAAILAEHDVADDAGVGRDPESARGGQNRAAFVEGVNGHRGGLRR